MTQEFEAKLRKLRAAVYGECSDLNWAAVKDNWAKPDAIIWLHKYAAKPPLPNRKPPEPQPA